MNDAVFTVALPVPQQRSAAAPQGGLLDEAPGEHDKERPDFGRVPEVAPLALQPDRGAVAERARHVAADPDPERGINTATLLVRGPRLRVERGQCGHDERRGEDHLVAGALLERTADDRPKVRGLRGPDAGVL